MAATAPAPKTAPRSPRGRAAGRRGAKRPAPVRRAAARRAGARRPARRPRQATPIPGGRLVPLAVGRTAGAVGGLADSGLVIRLTRGRLWIAALAALLVGIVALNVVSLSLNASSSDTARSIEELTRRGSALRAQLSEELSNERVQRVASMLGLIVPEPGSIRYLRPSQGDAAEAARRLRSGELATAPPPAPVATEVGTPEVAASVPLAEPVEPPAEPEAEAPPVAAEPPPGSTESPPAGDPGGGSASGGGVTSP